MEPTRRRDSGKFPECGAIFMSNTKTRRECFSRLLFALPRANLEFVRKVRKRMVLFLFDYQERKLYGVFEADSDGGLNIVPDAYTSSGKPFPAQVRIRIVWKCYPLREHEFRDAISDNYYEKYKFNFGLSDDQVKMLIHLFESRRVDIKKSPNEMKIKHSETSVDMSSSVGLELGDFIPLFSPERCDPTDDRSSPYYSKEDGNPRVKGLYSDRIEQKKSVFDRLEPSSECSTDFDMGSRSKRKRSCADGERMKVNKRGLLQSREILKWIKGTPKKANVFSRLKFNSESNNRETHISKEKERRDHHDKGIPFRKGMQEVKPFLNVESEGNSDRDFGDRRHNHSPVSGFLTGMLQMKRKLGTPILSAGPDQMKNCENSTVETKSVTLSDVSFISDPMKYLEHVGDLNQDQEKCAEKELLPSFGASDDLNQDQEKCVEKELFPSLGASDDLNQDQEKCAAKELLPSFGASDDLNQDQEKCAEKELLQSFGASDDPNQDQEKCAEKELFPSFVASDDLNQDQEKCAEKELLPSFGAFDDLNQDQEKCAESDLLLSFGASEMVDMVDNHKRCLENLETTTCLVADHENSDVEVINKEDKLDNSSGLNSVEKPDTIYKQHCLPVAPVENLETTTCLVADHENSNVEVRNIEDKLEKPCDIIPSSKEKLRHMLIFYV